MIQNQNNEKKDPRSNNLCMDKKETSKLDKENQSKNLSMIQIVKTGGANDANDRK